MDRSAVSYPKDYNPELNGIDGWLIFIVILEAGLASSGMYYILRYFRSIGAIFQLYIRIGIIMAALWIVLIAGSVWILIMIYKRRILFRRLFVIQTFLVVALYPLLFIFANPQTGGIDGILPVLIRTVMTSDFIITLVRGVIWITYLFKSKRVRNTYIYPFQYPAQPLQAKQGE